MFLNPSNILSLSRGPLALFFMVDSPFYRTCVIVLAMMTDYLDGYLARRYRTTSQLGAVLDPLMDKFFVLFIISIFMYEGKIQIWQSLSLISRDFAVLLFSLYLACRGALSNFQIQSIWTGKVTTTLQFFVLLALVFGYSIPSFVFFIFIFLGFFALIELYLIERKPCC